MRLNRPCCTLLFCFFSLLVFSQKKYTLSGVISEESSNETLIGVTVAIPQLGTGIVTNEYGFYSITLPEGTYEIVVSYIGYSEIRESIELTSDIRKNYSLLEKVETLDEVIVTEDVEKLDIKKAQVSVAGLTVKTIKQIPVVLGEADVVRSLVLLPGITNAGEASSGFNVRGGAVDQNLVLLDEATIFNSSHLFGLFSIFNPDAIKDVKIFKGGIPSRYGGRVSSVLDIYQREGNTKKFKVTGGIGAVASRLLVEGPIVKERTAFLAGGRASYAHLFLPLIGNDNSAYFFDLNAKISHKIDSKNSIYLSGYFGQDQFALNENFVNLYGNTVGNFRWNHLFSDKLFSNLSLIFSNYNYDLNLEFVGFDWNSGIQNLNLKYDLKHYISDKIQIGYGVNNNYYQFNPGEISPSNADSGIIADQLTQQFANETAAYVDVEHNVTDRLSLNYGLRGSFFTRLGQDEIFVYEDDNPVTFDPFTLVYREATPIDTISTSRGTSLATFANLEPRISAAYNFEGKSSVKASYTRLAQYIHLLSNTNSPTPLDVWTPSGQFIQPQILDQFVLGYFKNFEGGRYSLETEAFYKDIQNRIDYIDGANLIANEAVERVILNGKSRAFGLEILFKKNEGRFKGWIAYTLSRSEQKTPGRFFTGRSGEIEQETGINNGEYYPTAFDKTHDVSLFGGYDLNDKWNFNANFIYQTGQPTNFPVGQFGFQGLTVPFFGPRNAQRLPSFNRLDLSATLKPSKNKGRKVQAEWVFSIYNAYNRQNASAINFTENVDTGVNEAVRTSIFGIVPAVTYNFRF